MPRWACRSVPPVRPRRSLVFSLRPQTTNIGNDLIAVGADAMIRDVWPTATDIVSIPSSATVSGAKGTGLSAATLYEARMLADALFVGCGNVFENGALSVDRGALAALDVPLALFAVSRGRIRGRDGALSARTDGVPAEQIRSLCSAAGLVLVRDGATAEHLADLGVEGAIVGGCPSLFLDRHTVLPAADADLAGTALVSIRHPRLMSVSYEQQARVPGDLRALVSALRDRYDRVELLCHDYQDLAFAAGFPDVGARYTEDPQQFMSWLRGCAVSVGYRLHAFLTCIAVDIPAVHVSYDERGESMVELLGVERYDVRMHETGDIAAEVGSRLDAECLSPSPRAASASVLDELHVRMVDGLTRFGQQALTEGARRMSVR